MNKYLFVPVIIDIVFLLLFGFVFDFIKYNILTELEIIIKIIGSSHIDLSQKIASYSSLMSSLKAMPGFIASYHAIIYNLIMLVVLVYIL